MSTAAWSKPTGWRTAAASGMPTNQAVIGIMHPGQFANFGKAAATIGEMMMPIQTTQTYHTITSLAVIGAPAQCITGICWVSDQPATNQNADNMIQMARFWAIRINFDTFAHYDYILPVGFP